VNQGPAETLEQAIRQRAAKLAEQRLQEGEHGRAQIWADIDQRLCRLEEQTIQAARGQAERVYRRLVQASEIRLQADLDRQRWSLVESVFTDLQERLAKLHADEARYPPLFQALLRQGAYAIERRELIATLGAVDHQRFSPSWATLVAEVVPDKEIALSPDLLPCTGGLLVASRDHCIRLDNTFEGRLERLTPMLHQVIFARLFAAVSPTRELFHGG
jgi:V/A-type H+-transporting ATPase subunit E